MRNEATRDVLKTWLYAAASVLAGALAFPWIYNGCMALAEVTANRQTIGAMEKLGGVFGGWPHASFFSLSLILSACALFLPFAAWLRLGGHPNAARSAPWSVRLPPGTVISGLGQPLAKNPAGPAHWIAGVLLAAGVLLLMGYALSKTGAFVLAKHPSPPTATLAWLAFLTIALPLLLEILFRGIAMGVFLRAMRPAAAILLTALLSSLLYFFFLPPARLSVADPEALSAGLSLLGRLAARLAGPVPFFTEFAPLLAAAFLFTYARWRTASLWLPAGLHTGWMLANGLFPHFATAVPHKDPIARLLAGDLLRHGLLSLIGIIIIVTLVHFLTATHARPADPPP